MPLILAIEPDRRQANQLNAVVKGRLHADLVLADSAELALAALGDRVPDLILTTALLSPTDEVVLGERLRALNGVAAHVQTLTIPVLAGPRPRLTRARGMLSALRRGKPQQDDAPDGCDPTVFAAQCAEYLERAAADRAVNDAEAVHHAEPIGYSAIDEPQESIGEGDVIREFEANAAEIEPIVEPAETMPEPIVNFMTSMLDPIETAHEPMVNSLTAAREADEATDEPKMSTAQTTATVRTPAIPLIIDAPAAAATVQHAIAQIEAYVAREALASDTIAKIEANEHADETDDSDIPEGFIELDLSTLMDDPPADAPARREEDEPAALESSELDLDEDDKLFVYDINDINVSGQDDPMTTPVAATPAAKAARAEKAEPARVASAGRPPVLTGPMPSKFATKRRKPIQSDWGFFDPEQCGFAALIAKLDEIIKTEDRTGI